MYPEKPEEKTDELAFDFNGTLVLILVVGIEVVLNHRADSLIACGNPLRLEGIFVSI